MNPAHLFALAALALAAPPASAGPAAPAQDHAVEAFDQDLERVSALVANRRWEVAREQLLELFEAHRENPSLRTRWCELESLFVQATFWSTQELPSAKDAIEGELISYSKSSGKIKIKYRSKEGHAPPWDFEVHDEAWVHPVPFAGPYHLKVKGTPAPGKAFPLFVACWNGEDAYVGTMNNSSYQSLVHVTGKEGRVLDRTFDTFPNDRWFEVLVLDRKISFGVNDKEVLSAAKPKDLWGRAGFYGSRRSRNSRSPARSSRPGSRAASTSCCRAREPSSTSPTTCSGICPTGSSSCSIRPRTRGCSSRARTTLRMGNAWNAPPSCSTRMITRGCTTTPRACARATRPTPCATG